MINLELESKITTESDCIIDKINESSYSLNCELKDNINGDLQSAISFINDEEILLVNFDSGYSIITTNNPYENYFSKKTSSNDLNSGKIVAIILPIVFVLIAIIGIIIYLKNKKNNDKNELSSRKESASSKIV